MPNENRKRPEMSSGAKRALAQHQKKKQSRKRAAVVVFSVLLAIVVAIIVLIAVAVSMARDMYGHVYETDIPVVDAPSDDETAGDPGIHTDEYGNYETWGADETEDPDADTIPMIPGVPSVTEDIDDDEGRETLKIDDPTQISKQHPIYKVDQINKDVLNIVIVGRDEGGSYYGRADSAMLLSINQKKNSIKLISLMRDTYVPIKGHNWNKLGHAMSYGGMGLYINTVNKFYDLDVQQYAKIDFKGVVDLVDRLGGVEVQITEAEKNYYKLYFGYEFVVGKNTLNGEQALRHCRNRSLAGTDFERTRRQRDVVIAIYNDVLAMGMTKGMALIEDMLKGGYVKTNIPFNTCIAMARDVFLQGGLSNLQTDQIPFDGAWEYAKVQPPGYTSKMHVTVADQAKNKEMLRKYLYS